MKTRELTWMGAVALMVGALAVGCGGEETPTDGGVTADSGTPDSGVQVTLTSIAVSPETVTLAPGATRALSVTGTYSDGSSSALTSGVVFTTSDSGVALVDTVGVVTAVAEGTATITAKAQGLEASAAVTVEPEVGPTGLPIFDDDFAAGVTFEDFAGATNALSVDTAEAQVGSASLKIEVPAAGYTGGAMKLDAPADLSGFDAVTFWAKASAPHVLNVTGLGNDAADTTYQTERTNVALTTTWTRYIIPIPLASKLGAVQGAFHFAEGSDEGAYTVWLDDVRYEALGAAVLSNPRPAIGTQSLALGVGGTGQVAGAVVTFAADGADVTVIPTLAYFTLSSSSQAVATVSPAGLITAVGEGTATITGQLGSVDAAGAVTVTVTGATPERVVFGDDYGTGVTFQDFGGATNALTLDTAEVHEGTASLRLEVPAAGYTGGAFKLDAPADLSGYDAVSFWAKASADHPFNVFGLGNDATTSVYQAEWNGVALTGTWTRYIIPIPSPGRLTAEGGLFHLAEGSEHGAYTVWLDDIRYVALGAPAIDNPRPAIATETVSREVGGTFQVNGTSVTYSVNGADQTLSAARSYFTYASSAPAVATVDAAGNGTALAVGTTEITAQLNGVAAGGLVTVEVTQPSLPTTAAPTPGVAAGDVISLFSNAYTNATVDTWSAVWDSADVADAQVAGNDVKVYTNLVFAGIEFTSAPVDATAMTHFHLDLWTPNSTVFRVKLVDFGADGAFAGGDDTEHELTFDAASTPPLMTGTWQSLDIPFTAFTNLAARAHLAQLIIVGSSSTVYVDNVYFHR